MLKYLKYTLTPALVAILIVSIFMGGTWLYFGLALIVTLLVGGDMLLGEDTSRHSYGNTWILNGLLYLTLPLSFLMVAVVVWSFADSDFLNVGFYIQQVTGYDVLNARMQNTIGGYVATMVATGLLIAGYATNVGHELTHRTNDKFAMVIGRWLLTLSGNVDFSIEHVYGHHMNIATKDDPATARRGESLYKFIFTSTYYGHISAWNLEKSRLDTKGYNFFSYHNLMFRGYLMTLSVAGAMYFVGGFVGVAVFAALAMLGKAVLEIVNYIEHYGLVRQPGQPVMPKHSWNTNKRMSSMILFSLTRHSAHHEKGDIPFWKLSPYEEAPEMPYGYLSTILICLVPFWWRIVIQKHLDIWDANQASDTELQIIRNESRKDLALAVALQTEVKK